MRRDEKIKLMVNGLYRKRHNIDSDDDVECFSCKDITVAFNRRKTLRFCRDCWDKYFVRKTGTELDGMDYTRECVRIRDKHTCQLCLRVWVYGERRFDVHHLNGVCGRKSRSYDKTSEMDGLTTLCHKCHMNLEEVVDKMRLKISKRKEKRQYFINT